VKKSEHNAELKKIMIKKKIFFKSDFLKFKSDFLNLNQIFFI